MISGEWSPCVHLNESLVILFLPPVLLRKDSERMVWWSISAHQRETITKYANSRMKFSCPRDVETNKNEHSAQGCKLLFPSHAPWLISYCCLTWISSATVVDPKAPSLAAKDCLFLDTARFSLSEGALECSFILWSTLIVTDWKKTYCLAIIWRLN